jgi:serine/threonine protein phosphatase 1
MIHENVVFLKGNHEEKLLEFLGNPEKLAKGFFTYGGEETALSYGVKSGHLDVAMPNARKIRNRLLDKISEKQLKFFNNLGVSASIGDYFFCHAGIRPGVKLKKQSDHDLMWIRQEFLASNMLHKKIIVHGHTPRPKPEILRNRINVDTKCYTSGVLTCVVLEKRKRRFIQTGNKG